MQALAETVAWLLMASAGHGPSPSAPPDPCAEVRTRIAWTYDFLPTALDETERPARNKRMDEFWQWMESDPKGPRVSCLRHALADTGANRFFLFDGAMLLVKLSKDPGDLQAAADAVAQHDFRQTDRLGLLTGAQDLACLGADISGVVKRVLAEREFDVHAFHGGHAINLSRPDVLITLLRPMKPEYYRAQLGGWLRDRRFPEAHTDLIVATAWMMEPQLQTDLESLLTDPRTDAAEGKLLETYVDLERKSGRPRQLNRRQFEEYMHAALRSGRLDPPLDREALEGMKELVEAADSPLLAGVAKALFCRAVPTQHQIEEYGPLLEMMQVAVSEQRKARP